MNIAAQSEPRWLSHGTCRYFLTDLTPRPHCHRLRPTKHALDNRFEAEVHRFRFTCARLRGPGLIADERPIMQTRYRACFTKQSLCQIGCTGISISYPKEVAAAWTGCRFARRQNIRDRGKGAATLEAQRKHPPRTVLGLI